MTISSIHNSLIVKQPQNTQQRRQVLTPVAFTAKKADPNEPQKLRVIMSLGAGFIQPIKDIGNAIINAPLASFVVLGATAAAMRVSKLFAGALTVGIAGYGAYKTAAGTIKAAGAIKEQKGSETPDYKEANAHIKNVGEGLFDVALTANAAVKSVKAFINNTKAIAAAKGATIEQKIYAAAKQLQKSDDVLSSPKTFTEIGKALKEEGMAEITKLKSIFNRKTDAQVASRLGDALKTGNATKEQVIAALQEVKNTLGDKSGRIGRTIEQLQKTDTITSLKVGEIAEIESLMESIDAAKEAPAAVKVLRQVMGSVDDVAKVIKKRVVGGNSVEAAKVAKHASRVENLAAAGISTGELSEAPNQMIDDKSIEI